MEQALAVNYKGFSDSLVLEPLPLPPVNGVPVNETEVVYSDELQSGNCGNLGNWATVCSRAHPDWAIVYESFGLTGDRTQCGSFSVWQQTEKTDRKVCYQFRTQGHN
jgi:hypothetical protein